MATRLYPLDSAAAFTPTAQGVSGGTPVARALAVAKSGAQETRTVPSVSGYAAGAIFVSPPLAQQTISGTFTAAAFFKNIDQNFVDMEFGVRVWVSAGATSTVRGTLLTQAASLMRGDGSSSGGAEDAHSPNDAGSSVAVSSVAAQAGDRLIVQFDGQAGNTGVNFRIRWGGTGADATAGSTTTTQASWVQLSHDVVWYAPGVRAWICE